MTAVLLAALAFGTTAQASTPKILPYPHGTPLVPLVNHLNYYGGPVMAYERNVLVLWGSHTQSASSAALNSMLTDYATSPGSYNVPVEYGTQGLGAPTTSQPLTNSSDYSGSPVQITPSTTTCGDPTTSNCQITDATVANELNAQISAGHLPAPVQAFGGPVTYYSVLFPTNVQICMPSGDCSGVQFCAYHNSAYHGPGATNVFMYGVIPDGPTTSGSGGCGASPTAVNNLESYFNHELDETITDAEVGFAPSFGPPLAWYDPVNGEIGDICNAQQATVSINGHSYTVQKEWSNAANNCVASVSHTMPTANASSSGSGLTRGFDGSSSTPGAGGVTSYLWDFGDGSSVVSGATTSHAFPGAGTYLANLIVTNSGNFSARKELSVTITPAHLTVAKAADAATVTAGGTAGFTVTLGNTGDDTAAGISVTDALPARSGISWGIADQSGGWSISGSPPSQSLVAPASLAGGGSTHVHVTSATTNSSCGTLNNSVSASSTNGGSGSASAAVTVSGCVAPKPKCVVPKVVGKKLAAAKTRIKKAHCSVGKITRKHAAKSKRGKVIAQSPKPGRKLAYHTKVKLTVGK